MVEKVGLYWHFVDLVWVFVFTFYLFDLNILTLKIMASEEIKAYTRLLRRIRRRLRKIWTDSLVPGSGNCHVEFVFAFTMGKLPHCVQLHYSSVLLWLRHSTL